MGGGVAAIVGLVTLAQCAGKAPAGNSTRVVSVRSLNCRSAPSASGPVAKGLRRGQTVEVIEERGGWARVGGATPCWVSTNFLRDGPVASAKADRPVGKAKAAAASSGSDDDDARYTRPRRSSSFGRWFWKKHRGGGRRHKKKKRGWW